MAIAGNSSYIPAVRVCIYDRQLKLCPPFHNVPREVLWMPEQAAARFVDCPDAYIYVPTSDGGGTIYLSELLEEMDMIDPIATPVRYDLAGEPYHFYADGATRPQLCEIRDGWVWLMDAERAIHRSKLAGRFVRLAEVVESRD